MKRIIIQGSARSNGNTHKIVQLLQDELEFDVIDLNQQRIEQYDYQHRNHDDDFLSIMRNIVHNYDLIVFATPIYWYSMSGIMKAFFDRITDCLKTEKDTGRKLRGKKMAMISVGSDEDEIEGFQVPFRESAGYLGMEYWGDVHTWIEGKTIETEVQDRVVGFAQLLKSKELTAIREQENLDLNQHLGH